MSGFFVAVTRNFFVPLLQRSDQRFFAIRIIPAYNESLLGVSYAFTQIPRLSNRYQYAVTSKHGLIVICNVMQYAYIFNAVFFSLWVNMKHLTKSLKIVAGMSTLHSPRTESQS